MSNLRLATHFEKGWGEREKNPDERKLKEYQAREEGTLPT